MSAAPRTNDRLSASWRPGASREALRARADLLDSVRAFFRVRDVLEVETPLLGPAADPAMAIEPIRAELRGISAEPATAYLQTSPELYMKRLLAAGSDSIFQITRAFRDGEIGRRHRSEFTLLEWYRVGFDDRQLMAEIVELLRFVLASPKLALTVVSYVELFRQHLGLDVLSASADQLRRAAIDAGLPDAASLDLTGRDAWCDLLMSLLIEPALPPDRITLVTDFPASQAALARINQRDPRTAARFEVFLGGLELANGYHELTDPEEQLRRFDQENLARAAAGGRPVTIDRAFLAALQEGMPACAGVALGLDRLAMIQQGVDDIAKVRAF